MSKLIMIKTSQSTGDSVKNVNYTQQGTGAPVVLIHGLAASLFDWNDLIPEIAGANYCAYALDLLGHGKSVKPENINDYNISKVFEHFSGWIESLQINQPMILIGHSLGGYLAIQYTLRHPERIRALVLVDPFFSLEQLPYILRKNYQRALLNSTIIERTPEWVFRRVIDFTSLFIRNGYVLPEAIRIQTAADYKRAHPGIFNIIQTIEDPSSQLSGISQPVLILWGALDQTLSPVFFSNLLQALPNSRGAAIPGAGHVPHQSHPTEINRLVMEFLRTL